MKLLKLLRHYLKGIRLSALVLSVMMFWAIFMGVIAFSQLRTVRADVDALKAKDAENMVLLVYFPTKFDIESGADSEYAQTVEADLEAEELVETVLTIRTVNPVSYGKTRVSIALYEPELLKYFPGLKKTGMNFSAAPDGCILGSTTFNALDKGDTISLKIGNQEVSLPVAGHLNYPYRHMTLSVSATNPSISDFFKDGDTLLMQATESNEALIGQYAKQIVYHQNVIVIFKEEATQAQRDEILQRVAPNSVPQSFAEVWDLSNDSALDQIRTVMPRPLFLATSAVVALFSILVLTFHKKRRDTALLYLCGFSRQKCGLLVFTVFQLITTPVLLLSVLYIYLWPYILWRNFAIELYEMHLPEWLVSPVWGLVHYSVSPDCLIIVLIYYLVTLLISVGVAIWSMVKYTPTAYLRGVLK